MELSDLKAFFDPAQPLPKGDQWKPGVLFNVKDADYHAFRGVSSSLLKAPTAAQCWHEMNQPSVDKWGSDSEAAKWTDGILAHWAVLEPWRFKDFMAHCVLSPTKGLGTQRAQAVRAGFPDKLLVTPEHVVLAKNCRAAIEAHPLACELLGAPGGNEVSIFWFDPELKYWRKGRFDRLPLEGNFILDVKTTSADLPKFQYEIRKYGYHVQAAWYLDLLEIVTGERRDKFVWTAVTKDEPFMCRLFEVENWPFKHALYKNSPLKGAREIIEARLATFITSLNETITAIESGMRLDPALVRSLWPAYEHMPTTIVDFPA